MNIGWTLRRLAAMGAREILFRVARTGQAQWERLGLGLAGSLAPTLEEGRAWVTELPQQFVAAGYLVAADRILAGEVDLFALRPARAGFPPQWNCDPRTGIVAPLGFGKLIDYRNHEIVGDIKYLWELNRHLELVTLAQAWHLSRETRYAEGCRELLQSWFEQCPYPRGPNWTSSLEHGIRLVNWAVAWQLLRDSPLRTQPGHAAFLTRWRASVYQHCHFIAGHLSRHSSANNHLLGELAGLLIGALNWPCWPNSRRWAVQAQREFEVQCLRQTAHDGVNREQATWYHHSVADMMLLTGLCARANGCDFSTDYWHRLEQMLEFLASIMDAGGNVPAFGDADDALLVRWSADVAGNGYRALLAAGGLLFKRADLQAKGGLPDDKARWLLGDVAMREHRVVRSAPATGPVRRAFPEGGYYILGVDFESPEEIRVVADAGPLGYLAIAAHGHADALSFTLSTGGREILIDPGTYAYHTQPQWRAFFRGTSAHNTLRLDGCDQSVQLGAFLWGRRATVSAVEFSSDVAGDRLSAEHDGYRRLANGARVGRSIDIDRGTRTLSICDRVQSAAPHTMELYWHFSEHCEVTIAGAGVRVRNHEQTLALSWPEGLSARLVRAAENPPLGWRSLTYDSRIPITTLVIGGIVSANWQGTTTIRVGTVRVDKAGADD